MKKVLLSCMVLSVLLQAEGYTLKDRVADMSDMAAAMNTIQSGFFYNNYETLEAGVEQLTQTVENVKTPEVELGKKDVIERHMDEKFQMTNKIVKKINKKAFTLLERYKSGDRVQALQAYTKIMKQCMACHSQLRKW